MPILKIIDKTQSLLAKSPLIFKLVMKIHNQTLRIIKHHLSEGQVAQENGEALLVSVIAADARVFIDVGANLGNWTNLFLEYAKKPVIGILFEPSTFAYNHLKKIFENQSNLQIVNAAVGESSGEMTFYEEPDAGYMSSLIEGFSRSNAIEKKVKITTISNEMKQRNIDYIDLLKIDAEGYDFKIISGCEHLLKEQKIGVIQFEYSKGWALVGNSLALALKFFDNLSYKVFLLKSDGLYEFDYDFYGELYLYSNFVAISSKKMDMFKSYLKGRI